MEIIREQDLTEAQWQAAHQIAIKLAPKTDVNEFRKAISYLRTIQSQDNAGKSFFSYLTTLAKNGDRIGHSGKTSEYYNNIDKACSEYLVIYESDSSIMLKILGWAARLIKYYKKNSVAEDSISATKVPEPSVSKRQEEIAQQVAESNFSEDQIVDAIVTNKNPKGKKVTYTIVDTTIKLTNKEPKYYDKLSEEQQVKVKIIKLEDEKIKKIKLICREI